jgi:hypothetical protein
MFFQSHLLIAKYLKKDLNEFFLFRRKFLYVELYSNAVESMIYRKLDDSSKTQ